VLTVGDVAAAASHSPAVGVGGDVLPSASPGARAVAARPVRPAPTSAVPAEQAPPARPTGAERGVAAASAVLGTLGVLLGLLLAGVDAYGYDTSASCAAYARAHAGRVGFGCTSTSRSVALLLPALGLPLLVVAALALVWVPEHSTRRRAALLVGLAAVLVLAVTLAALAYSALPSQR